MPPKKRLVKIFFERRIGLNTWFKFEKEEGRIGIGSGAARRGRSVSSHRQYSYFLAHYLQYVRSRASTRTSTKECTVLLVLLVRVVLVLVLVRK